VVSANVLSVRLPYEALDLRIDNLGYFNFLLSPLTGALKSTVDQVLTEV
jgi:hypothetical protein